MGPSILCPQVVDIIGGHNWHPDPLPQPDQKLIDFFLSFYSIVLQLQVDAVPAKDGEILIECSPGLS